MEDKELLELAAIAYTGGHFFGFDNHGNALLDPVVYCPFNPLVSDADAMQLLVELGINIEFSKLGNFVSALDDSSGVSWIENYSDDDWGKISATRRAVTMAAALIGRRMK